jgi:hypothetical protein
MSIYVFTGPTLSRQEAQAELDAVYLPPVSQGDLYRAARRRPRAIGIIDGYFERVPSVWHKEILWAMSQGIHVYGSASMGGLRAAELAAFGMQGVGIIFEAYRDGMLEDDDEVAVAHAQADCGYRATSEAMINIRFTLAEAEEAGIITSSTCASLVAIAKNLYYPQRAYPLILQRAKEEGMPVEELQALVEWLPKGQVNQKREDALEMLRAMREHLEADLEPKRVSYSFEYTDMWDHVSRMGGELHVDSDTGAETIWINALLDEMRLQGDRYLRAKQGAMVRLLTLAEARRYSMEVGEDMLQRTIATFCCDRGLAGDNDLASWLTEQHVSQDDFARLMREEAEVAWVTDVIQRDVIDCLLDYLRISGDYSSLLSRAKDKHQTLERWGLDNPALADIGLTREQLLQWHFNEILGRPVPADVESYARTLGFEDEDLFMRAVLLERCYFMRREQGTTELDCAMIPQ